MIKLLYRRLPVLFLIIMLDIEVLQGSTLEPLPSVFVLSSSEISPCPLALNTKCVVLTQIYITSPELTLSSRFAYISANLILLLRQISLIRISNIKAELLISNPLKKGNKAKQTTHSSILLTHFSKWYYHLTTPWPKAWPTHAFFLYFPTQPPNAMAQ